MHRFGCMRRVIAVLAAGVAALVGAAGVGSASASVDAAPGGWRVVPSPNRGALSVFAGVTAVSANDFWAVGVSGTGDVGPVRPLIARDTGAGWRLVPSPAILGRLAAVDAVSARDVWAVGARGTPDATLAVHFDGVRWQAVPTPAPGASSALRAVAAVSADDVWAVGERAGPATLIEHWDGRRWRVVPSPTSPEVGGSRL